MLTSTFLCCFKYIIEFTIGQATSIPRFITLAQTDQIFNRGRGARGVIRPPSRTVVDQKRPGQIGLRKIRKNKPLL